MPTTIRTLGYGILIASLFSASAHGAERITFDRPAREAPWWAWETERLPIGNGSIGAMLTGGITHESVQFNVDSLWTGDENLSGAVGAKESILTDRKVGDYQNFGELTITFGGPGTEPGETYSRTLDLSNAVHTVVCGSMVREAFASAPRGVIALRFLSTKPFKASLGMRGAHNEITHRIGRQSLSFSGKLENGLAYTARADWKMIGTTNLIVYLRAKTSFNLNDEHFGLGADCPPFSKPFDEDFDQLKEEHIADYRRLYSRVSLSVGDDDSETLFNLARYLLISSSRPTSLPANLQGLWNNTNNPAWHSDYHTNINLQMNYWAADAANLSETIEPLFTWLMRANKTAEKETRLAFPDSDGVAYRTSLNLFGGGGWKWNFAGAPWLAVMAYDHYLYTKDEKFLREKAWPLMSDAAAFMLGHLVEGPEGTLLVKDGWSPEHGPVENGVMHDQQIMRELLIDLCAAEDILFPDGGAKRAWRIPPREALKRLGGDKIGSWGQLQEWQTDRDVMGDVHRHTSHLFAVYPGTTITLSSTPRLALAAAISLGIGRATTDDSRRSWTWPWRAAIWARLGRGDKAGEMISGLIRYNIYRNGFTTHPPFQIDGNFGFAAAVCEMLVQSHEVNSEGKRIVRILPAVPPDWKTGSVKGLRIRGGGTVDIEWSKKRLVSYKITGCDESRLQVILPVPPVVKEVEDQLELDEDEP